MEFLLPTEVARLVYGYLEDEGCVSAAKAFLESSSHLKECLQYSTKGRRFNTKVLGMGLVEMLDLLAEVTCYVRSIEKEARGNNISLGDALTQLKLTLKLGNAEDTVEKPVYLRITMPPQSQTKPKDSKSKSQDASPTLNEPPESPAVPNSHALQVLLEKKELHEKLAENINKVVADKCDADSLERILEKKIVETIVNTTEKDPIFQEMLDELVGPMEARSTNPEDTGLEQGESQQDSRNTTLPIESTMFGSISAPVTPHQDPSVVKNQTSSCPPQQMPFLVNSSPYLTQVSPAAGYSSQIVSRNPIQNSVLPQGTPIQSYVVTSAPGKMTLNNGMTQAAVPPASHAVAPPMSTRYKAIAPAKPPVKSSIKILNPATNQLLSAADIIQVPSNQGSVLQGLLNSSSCVVDGATMNVVKQTPPLTDTTSIKLQLVRPMTAPGIRVGGVRTRGGKAKTYSNTLKNVSLPNSSISKPCNRLINEKKVEDMNLQSTPVASALPEPVDPSTAKSLPKTGEQCEQVATNVSSEYVKVGSTFEILPSTTQDLPPVADTSTESTTKEVHTSDKKATESNTAQPVGNNPANSSSSTTAPERPDATPQQDSEPKVKLRKRLSLSTPRKGSHVRALEFKTPPKCSSVPKKSLSSPKSRVPERLPDLQKMLRNVKKGELFKSPPKSDKKSWDAELRDSVKDPCDDIPTSVGLKRVEPEVARTRRKSSTPTKIDSHPKEETSPKTPDSIGKSETNEDLVTRIERAVLDVIDEEDLSDVNINNKSTDSIDSPKMTSPLKNSNVNSVLEIGDIGIPSSTIKKLYRKGPPGDENSSTLDSPISKGLKDDLFVSPSRSITCPLGDVTPSKTGKLDVSLPNTPASASLEATLIRECSRIESEGMGGTVFGTKKDLTFGEKFRGSSFEKNTDDNSESDTSLLPPPKGILVLKTPAKSSLPVPVEMTPLSKIINEETRLGNCSLLTPTIPPTPEHAELKSGDQPNIEDVSPPNTNKSTPKASRKSSKTPTKTPHVRLKTKQQPTKTRSSKKKISEKIDCDQLIAQCLQSVKESVYGKLLPDSDDSLTTSATMKKSLDKKTETKKRKSIEKKKIKEQNKPDPPPEIKVVVPSFAEMIERYEKINEPVSLSSDDSIPPGKPILTEPASNGGSQMNVRQSETGEAKNIEESRDLSKEGAATVLDNSTIETAPPVELDKRSQVHEIQSPASPKNIPNDFKSHLFREKVDLDTYTMNYAWETEAGIINRIMRTSKYLDIYSYPPVDEIGKPRVGTIKVDESKRGDFHQSRRRRRSSCGNSEEDEGTDRKRQRMERKYENKPLRSPRGRGRGRSSRGRGGYRGRRGTRDPYFRDRPMDRREPRRRSSRNDSESNDEDDGRRSKSGGRCPSTYSRDRSRSRPGSDCDGRSPESNWTGKKFSSRKERSRERERSPMRKSPSGETRRDRPTREPPFRKNNRQEIKADRLRQEVKTERIRQESNTKTWGDLKAERAWLESKAERTKNESMIERVQFHVPQTQKRELPPPPLSPSKCGRGLRTTQELEEGEISDTSRSTILSFSKNSSYLCGVPGARLSSPVADENRQALLQRVDLDQFLSLVHGEDKSSTL